MEQAKINLPKLVFKKQCPECKQMWLDFKGKVCPDCEEVQKKIEKVLSKNDAIEPFRADIDG